MPIPGVASIELEHGVFQATALDPLNFEGAIATQGVPMEHWVAMRCPVGMTDLHDGQRSEHDHANCTNGFLYFKAGIITVTFTGNGEEYQTRDTGFVDGSSAQATFQRYYDDDPAMEVHVAPFDRLFLTKQDIVVPHWQLFLSRRDGEDRLQFKAEKVLQLIDATGKSYSQGRDFALHDGDIVWVGDRPAWDAGLGQGTVCSARYLYRPHWYVKQLLHQIRLAQIDPPMGGDREIVRMPHAAVLQREYVFRAADNDPAAPADDRQGREPDTGMGAG